MASFWDIVVEMRVGKLQAGMEEIVDAVHREGFIRLDISTAHRQALAVLPMHGRDPFDHLLMAQAIAEDATFISGDRTISRYPVPSISGSDHL